MATFGAPTPEVPPDASLNQTPPQVDPMKETFVHHAKLYKDFLFEGLDDDEKNRRIDQLAREQKQDNYFPDIAFNDHYPCSLLLQENGEWKPYGGWYEYQKYPVRLIVNSGRWGNPGLTIRVQPESIMVPEKPETEAPISTTKELAFKKSSRDPVTYSEIPACKYIDLVFTTAKGSGIHNNLVYGLIRDHPELIPPYPLEPYHRNRVCVLQWSYSNAHFEGDSYVDDVSPDDNRFELIHKLRSMAGSGGTARAYFKFYYNAEKGGKPSTPYTFDYFNFAVKQHLRPYYLYKDLSGSVILDPNLLLPIQYFGVGMYGQWDVTEATNEFGFHDTYRTFPSKLQLNGFSEYAISLGVGAIREFQHEQREYPRSGAMARNCDPYQAKRLETAIQSLLGLVGEPCRSDLSMLRSILIGEWSTFEHCTAAHDTKKKKRVAKPSDKNDGGGKDGVSKTDGAAVKDEPSVDDDAALKQEPSVDIEAAVKEEPSAENEGAVKEEPSVNSEAADEDTQDPRIKAMFDFFTKERTLMIEEDKVEVVVQEADPLQREAIWEALNSTLTLISGAAGTGKTMTTLALALSFASLGNKVFLGFPTNEAAWQSGDRLGELLTYYRSMSEDPTIRNLSMVLMHPEYRNSYPEMWQSNIVIGSYNHATGNPIAKMPFTVVILDDSSRVPEVYTLPPLLQWTTLKHRVLVGDPTLRKPRIFSENYNEFLAQMQLPLIERLICLKWPVHMVLKNQYRMSPEIAEFPAMAIYNDQIVDADCLKHTPRPINAAVRQVAKEIYGIKDSAMFWLDCTNTTAKTHWPLGHKEIYEVQRLINQGNAKCVADVIKKLVTMDAIEPSDILVLTYFNFQGVLIEKRIKHAQLPLEGENYQPGVLVKTIDSASYSHRPIVVVDFTISEALYLDPYLTYLWDARRLVAAITLASDGIIFVGNTTAMTRKGLYQDPSFDLPTDLVRYLNHKQAIKLCDQYKERVHEKKPPPARTYPDPSTVIWKPDADGWVPPPAAPGDNWEAEGKRMEKAEHRRAARKAARRAAKQRDDEDRPDYW